MRRERQHHDFGRGDKLYSFLAQDILASSTGLLSDTTQPQWQICDFFRLFVLDVLLDRSLYMASAWPMSGQPYMAVFGMRLI